MSFKFIHQSFVRASYNFTFVLLLVYFVELVTLSVWQFPPPSSLNESQPCMTWQSLKPNYNNSQIWQ